MYELKSNFFVHFLGELRIPKRPVWFLFTFLWYALLVVWSGGRYLAMVTAFLWWAPPSRNWFEIVLFIAAEVCWSMAAGMADWDPGLPDKESKLDFMKRSRRPTRSTFSELTDIIEVMLFSAVGVERPSSSSSKSDSCKKGGKNYWNCKYIQHCLVSLGI